MQGDHLGSIQDRLEKASAYYDLAEQPDRPKHGVPSLEYEELRRRVRNDIQEMWCVQERMIKALLLKRNATDHMFSSVLQVLHSS